MGLLHTIISKLLPSTHTLGEWLDIYSELLRRRDIQAKTLDNRLNYIRKIRAEFGNTRIQDVSARSLAIWLETVGKVHPFLAKKLYVELKAIFRAAMVYGWIARNPADLLTPSRVTVARSRLSMEQFLCILDYAKRSMPPWVSAMLLLAIMTGQRRQDIPAMQYQDVWYESSGNRYRRYLHVRQGKTGRRLAIPLAWRSSTLCMTLHDVIEYCRAFCGKSQYLVAKTNGLPPALSYMSYSFQVARRGAVPDALFLPKYPPSLHECRSLSARMFYTEGKTNVRQLLGHSSPSMTDAYLNDRGLRARAGGWELIE